MCRAVNELIHLPDRGRMCAHPTVYPIPQAIAPCYRGERAERRTEPNTVRVHPAPPHSHCMLLGFFIRKCKKSVSRTDHQAFEPCNFRSGPFDARTGRKSKSGESIKPVVPTYAILTPGRDRENLLSRDSRAPRRALLRCLRSRPCSPRSGLHVQWLGCLANSHEGSVYAPPQ